MTEPSNGELGRLIQLLRDDNRNGIAQINARLDRMVSLDVYAVEKAAQADKIRDLEDSVKSLGEQREKDAERVTQTRRWIFASVIIPIVGIVLPLYMALKGAGS